MEVRIDSQGGPLVPSPTEVVDHLAAQVRSAQPEWLRQLTEQPSRFADLEAAVHQTFQQLADQLVASLLAQATHESPALDVAKKK